MNIARLWKTAAFATLVGVGGLAAASSANAQATFRFNYNSGPRYSSHRECDRFGRNCYTVNCDRFGRNCYRSNYYGSTYSFPRGRYYVCDGFRHCAYAPYPREYYQRNPRLGFSFGFRF